MAEELFVKLSDVNALLPNCCEICREQLGDLQTVRLDGERMDDVRRLLERVNQDAKRLIKWASEPFSDKQPRRSLTPLQVRQLSERIQAEVEKSFGLPHGELLKRTNAAMVVWPRQIAMYIIRDLTFSSFPQIGQFFELHHTTVMHSIGKVTERVSKDKKLVRQINAITASVQGAQ